MNKTLKWIVGIVGIAVVLFLGLGIVAGPRFRDRVEARRSGNEQTGEIVTAITGDLSASVSGSGQLQAGRDARLAMGAQGAVKEIYVQVGDTVEAGQALVQLDTDSLERDVAAARQAVVIQEANLAQLLAPPAAASLAAAEAAVSSAQAQLDDLLAGPSSNDVEASEANVRAARANVWAASEQLALAKSGAAEAEVAAAQADLIAALGQQESTQQMYDRLLTCVTVDLPGGESKDICPGLGAPEEQTRANLEAADASLTSAQARLDALLAGPDADAVSIAQAGVAAASAALEAAEANHALLLNGAPEAQIAAAKANLAQAEANLASLLDGPGDAQLAAAEMALVQAQVSLERAQKALDDATLAAPFAGLVTAVHANVGETPGGVVVELAETGQMVVELDIDEVDIGNVNVGQPAQVSLEALPGMTLDGRVQAIAPAASQGSGVVSYLVTIGLDDGDRQAGDLLAGMTADATLTTAGYENVLLVPNQAINADRSSGRYTVSLVEEDDSGERTVTEVEVSLGLRDGEYTQITAGLKEGDRLLAGNSLPVQSFEDAGRRPFGGRASEGD